MQQPEDAIGRSLTIGQDISYVTRKSSNMYLHVARIVEITWTSAYRDWYFKVVTIGKKFVYNEETCHYEYIPYAHLVKLTSNRTIMPMVMNKENRVLIDKYLDEQYFDS